MQCPKDTTSLTSVSRYGVEIEECKECHGVWLDAGEITHLVQLFSADQKNEFKQLSERKDLKITDPGIFWNESQSRCPKDQTELRRHYFGGNSGIGIEQCLLCRGIWLDGGELESVRTTVAPNYKLDMAVLGFGASYRQEAIWKHEPEVDYAVEVLTKPEVASSIALEKAVKAVFYNLPLLFLKI